MTPEEAQAAAFAAGVLQSIIAATVVGCLTVGFATRSRRLGQVLLVLGLVSVAVLVVVLGVGYLKPAAFFLAPRPTWEPLLWGLIIGGGAVALSNSLGRRWGAGPIPPFAAQGATPGPPPPAVPWEDVLWSDLIPNSRSVLSIAWKVGEDCFLPPDMIVDLRGSIGNEGWNAVQTQLDHLDLIEPAGDGLTLTTKARALMLWKREKDKKEKKDAKE